METILSCDIFRGRGSQPHLLAIERKVNALSAADEHTNQFPLPCRARSGLPDLSNICTTLPGLRRPSTDRRADQFRDPRKLPIDLAERPHRRLLSFVRNPYRRKPYPLPGPNPRPQDRWVILTDSYGLQRIARPQVARSFLRQYLAQQTSDHTGRQTFWA